MRDLVLVGPGHCRAENHFDARGGVRPIANEDMCHTQGRRFLRNRPLRRATGSNLRSDHSSCAGQDQYAHQNCTYDEPHCSVTHLDLSHPHGYRPMATCRSIKSRDDADSLVALTRGTTEFLSHFSLSVGTEVPHSSLQTYPAKCIHRLSLRRVTIGASRLTVLSQFRRQALSDGDHLSAKECRDWTLRAGLNSKPVRLIKAGEGLRLCESTYIYGVISPI